MHHDDNRKDHEKGQPESHQSLDAKDEKSIKNKLAQAGKEEKERARREGQVRGEAHGRCTTEWQRTSRGAKIDEQIEEEERKMLEAKGIKTEVQSQATMY